MDVFPDRFRGRRLLVTGGADGIGAAVVQRLLKEGAQVIILDIHAERARDAVARLEAEGYAGQISAHPLDVSHDEAVTETFARIAGEKTPIDGVIHAAGIVGPNATQAVDISAADFDHVYRVNLLGSFLVAREAIRHMLPAGYGRILLFASIAGKEGNAGMSPYSATKAGVIGLTKSLGKEYAQSGITINAIAPAVIRTAMVENMEPWQVNYMTEKIPMGRCGTLDEAAALSCWIVSPEAGFSTGAVFDLSGGRATY